MTRPRVLLLAAVLLAAAAPAGATTLPDGFQETVVLRGLTEPTSVAFAADGRIFVGEKSGIIKVFPAFDSQPTVLADLRTNVFNFLDRGLHNVILHPDFPRQPYLYVLYTYDGEIGGTAPLWGMPGATSDSCDDPTFDGCIAAGRLSRLTVDGNSVVGGEQVMIENWCQQYPSHSVGGLAFDSAGALYVSAGEGGSYNFTDYGQRDNVCGDPPGVQTVPTARGGSLRSQNLARAGYSRPTYDGKILRIDPLTGDAWPGNPLVGGAVQGADRIIARGFRQPYRMTVRPGTNELWIGDVGWQDWEEINRLTIGAATVSNFGWPCFEGFDPQPGWAAVGVDICSSLYATPGDITPPVFAYAHFQSVVDGDGCATDQASITGIAFHSGAGYPAPYDGALFFGDFSRRCIWMMPLGNGGAPDPEHRQVFARDAAFPVDLVIGPGGDLYYVDVAGGTIRRIHYAAANQPPQAVATANVTSGPAPLTVHFDGTQSRDPEGGPLTYAWDLDGDGADDATTAKPSFTYQHAGHVDVRLRVTDNGGSSDEATLGITAGTATPPQPVIDAPSGDLHWRVGDTITVQGHATDAEDGTLRAAGLSWAILLHHCPNGSCHIHPLQTFTGVASASFVAPDHGPDSFLEVQLTATDSSGLQTTATRSVMPLLVTLRFETDPSGLTLGVNDGAVAAPFTRMAIPGSSNSISAPAQQTVGCDRFEFSHWSDDGAGSHTLSAPTADAVLIATYTRLAASACSPSPTASPGDTPTAPPPLTSTPATDTVTPVAPPTSTPGSDRCIGDCNGDGRVGVDEIVLGVSVALGLARPDVCPRFDPSNPGSVSIQELIAAVGAALDGCAAAPAAS